MESCSVQCSLCSEDYDEGEHYPRLLPCSHTFCSTCIGRLITVGNAIRCPICRYPLNAKSKEEFTCNRDLLNIAKLISKLKIPSEKPKERKNFSFDVWKEELRNDLQKESLSSCLKEKNHLQEEIRKRQELMLRLVRNIDFIDNTIFRDLLKIREQCERRLGKLKTENKQLTDKWDVLSWEEVNIKQIDEELESSHNFASADSFIATAKIINERLNLFQKELQDFLSIHTAEHLTVMKNVENAERYSVAIAQLLRQYKEKEVEEKAIYKIGSPSTQSYGLRQVRIEEIQRMPVSVVELAREGKLWAYGGWDQGRMWYSPIELTSDKSMFVHCMHYEKCPSSVSHLVKHEDILRCIGPSSRKTFLELGLDGEPLGKVVISLLDEGHYSDNFFHMCFGDKDLSYTNRPILSVWNKGKVDESILSVQCRAVIRGVNWKEEHTRDIYKQIPMWAGSLVACGDSEDRASQFFINTKSGYNPYGHPCFGWVVEGIEVIEKAIFYCSTNIKAVKIISCGVVIPKS